MYSGAAWFSGIRVATPARSGRASSSLWWDPPGVAVRPFLFGKGLRRVRRQRYLKRVQRVSDRRVIADDRAKFDDPLLAKPGDGIGKCRVGEPLGIDKLSNDAMDEDLVVSREAGRGAGADGLDRRCWDSGLDRERRMRVPFETHTQVTRGQADREL